MELSRVIFAFEADQVASDVERDVIASRSPTTPSSARMGVFLTVVGCVEASAERTQLVLTILYLRAPTE